MVSEVREGREGRNSDIRDMRCISELLTTDSSHDFEVLLEKCRTRVFASPNVKAAWTCLVLDLSRGISIAACMMLLLGVYS